jgi:OOP family OmpA-OmpF porin
VLRRLVFVGRPWGMRLAVWAALVPRPAAAQGVSAVDLRTVSTPTHAEGLVYLEPTDAPGQGEWNTGGWLSYAHRPVVLSDAETGRKYVLVRERLGGDLTFQIGVSERLSLGVTVPGVLYQHGDAQPALGLEAPPGAALANAAVDARATLLSKERESTLGLAVLAKVLLPTGHPDSYVGEQRLRSEIRLLAEVSVLGAWLRATGGTRLREEERVLAGERFGHDLPWGVGLTLRPQTFGLDRGGKWQFAVEGYGAVSLTPSFAARDQSPAQIALAGRRAFGNASMVAGLELPLGNAIGLPVVRAFAGVGYAPRVRDSDADGLVDERDGCAERPEDRDGFEDGDGCPEIDNDGDGIVDTDDRCPGNVEDLDGFEDDDGCSDPDDDRDGTPDASDACRREPGPADADAKRNGCPQRDRDMDGIPEPRDACVHRAEDRDGFEDEDGCPDLDDDRDGVRDHDDRCPRAAGQARSDPELHGCPSPDTDGDALEGTADRCPTEREDHDGQADDDGCPDPDAAGKRATPLAALEPRTVANGTHWQLVLASAIGFESVNGSESVTAASMPLVRAVAALMNERPALVLMVAVRPRGVTPAEQQRALTRSFALVDALRRLTHRDEVAETIGWPALGRVKGAADASGVGFLVLAPPGSRPGDANPATPAPAGPIAPAVSAPAPAPKGPTP